MLQRTPFPVVVVDFLSWFDREDSIGSSLCLAALNASLDNLPNSMLISWYLLIFALSSQFNSTEVIIPLKYCWKRRGIVEDVFFLIGCGGGRGGVAVIANIYI